MTRPDDGIEGVLDAGPTLTPTALSTGATLAAARADAGLVLADIAKDTRVPLRHLQAIENDAHDALPALPYAIGFVKSFARAVGLDAETLAAQFRRETTKVPHVPQMVTLEPVDERRLPSRGLVMASVAAVLLIIGALAAWGSGLFDPAPAVQTVTPGPQPVDTAPSVADSTSPAAPANGLTVPPADTAAAPGNSPVAPPAVAGGAVVLTAKEDVWIKIYSRATKTSAKIGILKSGEAFNVPNDPPGLLLWTGKAGALAITVGGKPVAALGGPVETVRDVSLAPADLLARAAPPAGASR